MMTILEFHSGAGDFQYFIEQNGIFDGENTFVMSSQKIKYF